MYRKINILIFFLLIVVVLFRFYFVFNIDNSDLIKKYSGQNIEMMGNIVNEPQINDFNQVFTLKTDETYIKIQTDRYTEYNYGDYLKVKGKLNTPRNFKSNGGRIFDYINFLSKDGIVFIMNKPEIEILNNNGGIFISKNLFKINEDSNFIRFL